MSTGWGTISRSATLDAAELSAREARRLVRRALTLAQVPDDAVETALLLVSELVTNAVVHAGSRPVLDVDVDSRRLRISVADAGAGTAEVQTDNPLLSEHGRGMLLVDSLSSRWGTDLLGSEGKSIWFELDAS